MNTLKHHQLLLFRFVSQRISPYLCRLFVFLLFLVFPQLYVSSICVRAFSS